MRLRISLSGSVLTALVLGSVPTGAMAQVTHSHTVQRTLDTVEPDLKFSDVALSDAIDYLRDTTEENIVVDWKSLEAVNIDRNTVVNIRLRNVTLRKALTTILSEAGPGNLLTFYVEDNVLQITTQAKADTVLYTMVYPVKDLLVTVPNFQLSDVTGALSSVGSSGGGTQTYGSGQTGAQGGGQSSSSSNIFSSGGSSTSSSSRSTPDQQGATLVKLIMDTIRPEVWKENGGNSTIRFFQGMLIVTAPISVQEAIGGPVD